MARTFVQPGETITVTAPYDVASGAGVLVGLVFGVALFAATAGSPVEIRRLNVWDIAKAPGQAWVAWTTKLYWDNTARVVTSTVGSNTPIGVAAQSQASADVIGRIMLTGQIV